ncbi:MAG: hypothetical protein COV48_03935 [Elusimicrobia bacterium CG11_big_fil_rev_8_21_14_0_20_64_6]|nr:MAG: hypothetical protein COV48_03935 [Elusimicrobia bacterium CG11_big_fil_rev_8_21_14_0_20_64_6]
MTERFKPAYFHAHFHAGLRGRKLPSRFAVVTAFNPRGKKSPPAANRRRDAALRRRLRSLGIKCFRVTGGNEDGSHREPGWGLIVPSPIIARGLAAEFRQDAYYWVSSGRIYLGSAAGGPLKRAGSWSARLARWN